jgi:hypothetical protein
MLLGLASGMTAGEVLLYPIRQYEMDRETISLLGRTFAAVFPTSSLIADFDRMIGAHRRLSPENRLFFENHNDDDTLLDLVQFAASANVPMFGVLQWSHLEQGQQVRYRQIVADYCGRVLVPSYGIFNNSELKAACADIQIAAIGKKITTDDEPNAIDHYNLALA